MNERERIELLMKCYNLSPSQFADRTGIQRASVSHIISGRNKPSLEVMLKIYEAFPGLDMKWLMTGIGAAPTGQAPEPVAGAQQESLFTEQAAVPHVESSLFAAPAEPVLPTAIPEEPKPRRTALQQPVRERTVPEARPRRQQGTRLAQMAAMQPDKKIKEIRIYYSDGTYETLIPEKQ
jgi:transcriptional regulator with XRE-family HTH domain